LAYGVRYLHVPLLSARTSKYSLEMATGGLFSTFDCAIKSARGKEDAWNAIGSGFLTGGALAMRGGFKAARNGAIGCAVLLAVIEGVGIGFQKMMAGSTKLEASWLPLFLSLSTCLFIVLLASRLQGFVTNCVACPGTYTTVGRSSSMNKTTVRVQSDPFSIAVWRPVLLIHTKEEHFQAICTNR
jgi:hypothetical protein